MQTEQIIALLIAERDRLNHAIQVLQGHGSAKAAAPKSGPAAATVQKRKPRSAAQRKAQSERMRAYWAARRKQKAK